MALAAALPQSGLTALYLEGCALGAAPMSRLAAALAASRLAVLDLASNEIMDEGAWELAWRLPECPHLERLLLAVSQIEPDRARSHLRPKPCPSDLNFTLNPTANPNLNPDPNPNLNPNPNPNLNPKPKPASPSPLYPTNSPPTNPTLAQVNEIEDDGAAELLSGLLAHDNVAAALLQP